MERTRSPLVKEQNYASTIGPTLLHRLVQLWREDSGQDIIEYALVAVSMGLFTVAGIHGLAASIGNDLNTILNAFNSATAGAT
jgi:Flp pilus assembly pilin Flp